VQAAVADAGSGDRRKDLEAVNRVTKIGDEDLGEVEDKIPEET